MRPYIKKKINTALLSFAVGLLSCPDGASVFLPAPSLLATMPLFGGSLPFCFFGTNPSTARLPLSSHRSKKPSNADLYFDFLSALQSGKKDKDACPWHNGMRPLPFGTILHSAV